MPAAATTPADIFDAIALGLPWPSLDASPISKHQPSVAELQLSYALAKQVPAMDRGFTISTSYGDIDVVPGPLAEQLQCLVRQAIESELAKQEQA